MRPDACQHLKRRLGCAAHERNVACDVAEQEVDVDAACLHLRARGQQRAAEERAHDVAAAASGVEPAQEVEGAELEGAAAAGGEDDGEGAAFGPATQPGQGVTQMQREKGWRTLQKHCGLRVHCTHCLSIALHDLTSALMLHMQSTRPPSNTMHSPEACDVGDVCDVCQL